MLYDYNNTVAAERFCAGRLSHNFLLREVVNPSEDYKMGSLIVAQLLDRSGEPSTIKMRIPAQAGAVTITEIISFATSLNTALEAITLMTVAQIYFQQDLLTVDPSVPTDDYANRETGARVFFHNDTTGDKGRITVPAPDLANVARGSANDEFDLTDTEMAALVTWMESNYDLRGESITVDKALFVGQNN